MATLGQKILERLDTLEATMTDLQLEPPRDRPAPTIMVEIERLKSQLEEFKSEIKSIPDGSGFSKRRSLLQNKECIPAVLGNDYKFQWRTWSYKTRDYFTQMDPTLATKLMEIECMTEELTLEF